VKFRLGFIPYPQDNTENPAEMARGENDAQSTVIYYQDGFLHELIVDCKFLSAAMSRVAISTPYRSEEKSAPTFG
jgi:hypothetical protein